MTDLNRIAVDFDGTLAEIVWPDPGIGKPILRNVDKLDALFRDGYEIIVHTSRPWNDYDEICAWLEYHDLVGIVSSVVCGKLLAAAYIDDRAVHESEESWVPPR